MWSMACQIVTYTNMCNMMGIYLSLCWLRLLFRLSCCVLNKAETHFDLLVYGKTLCDGIELWIKLVVILMFVCRNL